MECWKNGKYSDRRKKILIRLIESLQRKKKTGEWEDSFAGN